MKSNTFIGETFPAAKGGVLTVTSKDTTTGKYICECSICSKDRELWPIDSIKIRRAHLQSGVVPCGCSKGTKFTEEQVKLLVTREASTRGFIFNGWFGEYKGQCKTYCNFQNKTTLHKWSTTTIESFLRGTGDPKVASDNRDRKPDAFHINAFYEGGFDTSYHFTRNINKQDSNGHFTYFDYTCDSCSNDTYVMNGLCSGVFTTTIASLKRGQKACRCAVKFIWTKPQREHQIKELLKIDGGNFIEWVCWSTTAKSKFRWLCSEGHENVTCVAGFVNGGSRCSTCNNGYNGYYPKRAEELDYLYLQLSSDWVKCGRSFNPSERIKDNTRNSNYNLTEIALFEGTHQDVYDIEQFVKGMMWGQDKNFYNKEDCNWSGATECYPNSSDNIKYILQMIHVSDLETLHEDGV